MTRNLLRLIGLMTVAATAFVTLAGCSSTDTYSRSDTQGLPDTLQSLEAYEWRLDGGASKPEITSSQQITLSVNGHSLEGRSGCNSYGGAIEVEGTTIKLKEITATEMACANPADSAAEAEFLQALGAVNHVDTTDRDRMVLSGERVELRFTAGKRSSR